MLTGIPATLPGGFAQIENDTLRLEAAARLAGWTPEAGPAVGVFSDKPDGHKALWSCYWLWNGKVCEPDTLGATLDHLTGPQLAAELADALVQKLAPPAAVGITGLLLAGDGVAIFEARHLLRVARHEYVEYIAPWSDSFRAGGAIQRPGWAAPSWWQPGRVVRLK